MRSLPRMAPPSRLDGHRHHTAQHGRRDPDLQLARTGGIGRVNSGAGTIGVTVPNGTNVAALVAIFTTSASITSIKVAGVSQVSGTTVNNFSSPVVYAVTAQDGATVKNWMVTVTIQPSTAAEILTYSVPGEVGSAAINSGAGTIGVTVPNGTNVSALVAIFTTSANITSIKVAGLIQVSGTTPNNFTNPVVYAVTAQDLTTKNWTVTVTPGAASTDANLTSLGMSAGTLTPTFSGNTTSYTANVANSITSVTVTPTVNESHATVTMNGVAVTSGTPLGQ